MNRRGAVQGGTAQMHRTTQEQQVTFDQSTKLMKNLVRTAVSSITYLRNIFPEHCYIDKKLTGLNIRTLIPNTPESKLLLNWLEQGVFDALDRHYLEDIVLAVYTRGEPTNILLECYQFHMTYPEDEKKREEGEKEDVTNNTVTKQSEPYSNTNVNITSSSSSSSSASKQGPNLSLIHTTGSGNSETHTYSREEIKDSTVRLIRTLISLAQTLKALPKDRFLTMKLQYRDDVTPADYEPKFFRAADEDDELVFDQKPFKVAVGKVQTQFHEISMKMKSIADSFGEGDDVIQTRAKSYNASEDNKEKSEKSGKSGKSGKSDKEMENSTTNLQTGYQKETLAKDISSLDSDTFHEIEKRVEDLLELSNTSTSSLKTQKLPLHGFTIFSNNILQFLSLELSEFTRDALQHVITALRSKYQHLNPDNGLHTNDTSNDGITKSNKRGRNSHNLETQTTTTTSKVNKTNKPDTTNSRFDYASLRPIHRSGQNTTTTELSSHDRVLFNTICGFVIENYSSDIFPKNSLLLQFEDDGLTNISLKVFLKEMIRRGIIEQVGKSSKYRVIYEHTPQSQSQSQSQQSQAQSHVGGKNDKNDDNDNDNDNDDNENNDNNEPRRSKRARIHRNENNAEIRDDNIMSDSLDFGQDSADSMNNFSTLDNFRSLSSLDSLDNLELPKIQARNEKKMKEMENKKYKSSVIDEPLNQLPY